MGAKIKTSYSARLFKEHQFFLCFGVGFFKATNYVTLFSIEGWSQAPDTK